MEEYIKNIVELDIDLDNITLEDMGVDTVSFVTDPAIEIDFMAFASQEFVKPHAGESEDEFIGRCIPVLIGEGKEQGEAVFHPFGGNTDYLDEVGDMLAAIHQGLNDSQAVIDVLLEHELLESFTLDIELDNGEKHQMIGFYTINEEKLNMLDGPVLTKLHQQGYLQAIYMSMASQSNVRDLLDRKNAQHKKR